MEIIERNLIFAFFFSSKIEMKLKCYMCSLWFMIIAELRILIRSCDGCKLGHHVTRPDFMTFIKQTHCLLLDGFCWKLEKCHKLLSHDCRAIQIAVNAGRLPSTQNRPLFLLYLSRADVGNTLFIWIYRSEITSTVENLCCIKWSLDKYYPCDILFYISYP